MFTGIVRSIGQVSLLEPCDGDVRLTISCDDLNLDDVELGDSIACSGACLTVIQKTKNTFSVDVSLETLGLTTVGIWKEGDRVNLEKAMMATDRFGGHIVSGHIDGIGEVTERKSNARSEFFKIHAPTSLLKYIPVKGSITVDGTSLTINRVNGSEFELNIIPQTLSHTVISDYRVGTKVNLEVDLIARYLEKLVSAEKIKDSEN